MAADLLHDLQSRRLDGAAGGFAFAGEGDALLDLPDRFGGRHFAGENEIEVGEIDDGAAGPVRDLGETGDWRLKTTGLAERCGSVAGHGQAGAEVDDVIAYRTTLAQGAGEGDRDIYRMLLDGEIDAVTFTSASTVRNFAQLHGRDQAADLLAGTTVACIGPVTAEAAQHLGIATTVMPERYTIPDLVDALVAHFRDKDVRHAR